MFYAVVSALFLCANIERRMVYFMDLVRYIILEHVALNMCCSKYLKGMPSYVTHTQKLSDSLLKIPRTVVHEGLTLLAPSPTACVQTRLIVNKSVGKELTNEKQSHNRVCQRESFLVSPTNVYILSLKLLLGKGASLKLEITVSFVMGLRDFLEGSSLSIDFIQNLVSSARDLMDF